MTDTINLLFCLLNSEICSQPFESKCELGEEELNSLYKISKKHDITQMLVAPLEEMSVLKAEYVVTEKYKKSLFTAIYRYEKSNFDLGKIVDLFSTEGIDHIPLKGSVIRSYYPKPYLRTSCDIDILVKKRDLEKATALLVEKLQYRLDAREQYDVSLFAPSGVHIELHFGLVERGFKEIELLRDIWQSGEITEVSPHCYKMTSELFLFYHIYHMAKHFVHGGCGVKPFIDLWIIKNKIGYDESRATELLKNNGLFDFYNKALGLTEIWLDGKEYGTVEREMEDYVLQGGVYGTLEQQVAMSQVKKGGKLGHLLGRIFISYKAMLIYYPSLAKCPALFPFYQVRRWFRVAFCGGRKRALNEMKLNQNLSEMKKEKAKRLLEELGL